MRNKNQNSWVFPQFLLSDASQEATGKEKSQVQEYQVQRIRTWDQ